MCKNNYQYRLYYSLFVGFYFDYSNVAPTILDNSVILEYMKQERKSTFLKIYTGYFDTKPAFIFIRRNLQCVHYLRTQYMC